LQSTGTPAHSKRRRGRWGRGPRTASA
jgi:hypothetical protein